MTFKELMLQANISEKALAKKLCVHRRTVKNWIKKDQPPRAVFLYLQFYAGDFSTFGKQWKHWRILHNGKICNGKYCWYPDEIEMVATQRWLILSLQAVIESQRKNYQLSWVDVFSGR